MWVYVDLCGFMWIYVDLCDLFLANMLQIYDTIVMGINHVGSQADSAQVKI
jgi:hypothetical protein